MTSPAGLRRGSRRAVHPGATHGPTARVGAPEG